MIAIDGLHKHYDGLPILNGVDAHIPAGRFAAIRGASGSGKSTLLLILGGLLRPDGGSLRVDETDLTRMDEAGRNRFRATRMGFVFQRFHLVPYLNVADNIRVAARAAGRDEPDRIEAQLRRFGLAHRASHEPGRLSVGEQQRCALARALVGEPAVVLADEPTGNLDPDNASIVLDAFRTFAADGGTVLMVTHDPAAAARADERWLLADGRLQNEEHP